MAHREGNQLDLVGKWTFYKIVHAGMAAGHNSSHLMKTLTSPKFLSALLLGLVLCAAATANAWKIDINPPGSVTFSYNIPQTGESGNLTETTIIGLSRNQTLNFTATANPGFDLVSIKHKAFDVMPPGSASPYTGSIPSAPEDRGTLKVQLKAQNPVGEVSFVPPTPFSNGYYRTVDATGTYTTTINCRGAVVSQTFDPAGKGDVMGTVDGVTGPGGTVNLDATASLKNKTGEPVVSYKGSIKGAAIDGVPSSGSGAAETSLALEEVEGQKFSDGVASGKGAEGVEKVSYNKALIQPPVSDENADKLKSDWSAQLDITEEIDAKGKKTVFAEAELTTPRGVKVSFARKPVKYSKRGYNLNFSNGTYPGPGGIPIKDSKTKLSIKGMTLTNNGTQWIPTGAGQISYEMLGQKAPAVPLSDVLP